MIKFSVPSEKKGEYINLLRKAKEQKNYLAMYAQRKASAIV